jgi:flagellar protein FliO/FliZ
VETRYVTPKKSLLLVEVGGEYLLLSSSGDQLNLVKHINMLEEIEVLEIPGEEKPGGAFRARLQEFLNKIPKHGARSDASGSIREDAL